MAESMGRLGAIECTSGSWKTLYKPAAGTRAAGYVHFANRAAATRNIKIAVVQSASTDPTPADGETFLSTRQLAANPDNVSGKDVLDAGPIALNGDNNDQVVVHADGVDVDAQFLAATAT